MSDKTPIVVLISGSGSNLQALIDQTHSGRIPGQIKAVISNRPNAQGLQRAAAAGIETQMLDHKTFSAREAFDQALMQQIDSYQPALVVLAGFMRILTPAFTQQYTGRMLNIHPSLLPAYRGLNTHERALKDAVKEHGASAHFVTSELDGGPVVLQARVPVTHNDTPQTLAARILEKEHLIYPQVVRWFCQGRLRLQDGQALLDGEVLSQPLQLDTLSIT